VNPPDVRRTLALHSGRLTELLRECETLDIAMSGGSVWTVRDAAVHVATCVTMNTEIASGAPSPLAAFADLDEWNARLVADVGESDPVKVADLVGGAVASYLATTEGWAGDHPVAWHAGSRIDLTSMTALLAGEVALHGHDIAAVLGGVWPITASEARLVLAGALPMLFGIGTSTPPEQANPVAFLLQIAGREFPNMGMWDRLNA
jgi:hypothetical protein